MADDVVVKIDLTAMKRFGVQVNSQLQGSIGPIEKALKQWGVRYRSFAQERFDKFSKGGGDWPALAESTLRRRRKGSKSRKAKSAVALDASILRDTNTMFTVLSPVFTGQPGAIQEQLSDGILVGYGGPHRHKKGGRATIADIASFHNDGAGNLPERKIIVPPPDTVVSAMAGDMTTALNKVAEQTT